jgi:hypothetical protein
LLNPSRPSTGGRFVSAAGLACRWFAILACLLVVGSLSGLAQSDLKERSGASDISTTVKQMTAEMAQAESVAQNPNPNYLPVRIIPFGRRLASQAPLTRTAAVAGAHLTYWGGPVISNVQVIVVLWGTHVVTTSPADGTATLGQFYTDITSSRYYDLLTEYTTSGIVGNNGVSTSNQTITHGSFGSTVTITPSKCPGDSATACTLLDSDIQTELTNQITAKNLPAPQSVAGIVNTYYAIYFPPNVTIQLDATTKSCVNGGFCAYHSDTNTGTLPYGVMPDFSSGGCSQQRACATGTTFQIATTVSSHEMAEAITDAQVGTASVFGPPLGWYDHVPPPGSDPGEIADICDPPAAPQGGVLAGGNLYSVEFLFSNVQNDCVAGPPFMQMPDTGAAPGVSFNLTLSVQNSNTLNPLSNYRGTVHFTSSDGTATLPADYTYLSSDAGAHTFQFTLNTLGSQTISAVDTHAAGFTGSANVNVSAATDLAASGSPAAISTAPGATGLTFATTVRNNGGTASTGTVTVLETVDVLIAVTALAGPGWTCDTITLRCTRSDALAPGANYPDITMTFNASSIQLPVTSHITSTVSGGGDTDLSNNTANGTVNFVLPITMGLTTPATDFIVAGGSAKYGIAVNLSPSTGTVTFTCSGLPPGANCTLSPTSLSNSGSIAMTVTTTARGTVVNLPHPGDRIPWLPVGLVSIAALALLAALLRVGPRARKLVPVFGTCALLLAGILAGCGGGGSPQTITNPLVGTPAGAYALAVTATSASGATSKLMVQLVVN